MCIFQLRFRNRRDEHGGGGRSRDRNDREDRRDRCSRSRSRSPRKFSLSTMRCS